ncbi:unnamed protein product [Hermetia illucens]|uniref:Uncharacterized protein n=1 Tax=Hermetia illucens TaxID=343691 RepID=A0A7R8USC7_HERIL|nr:uncharacterized protein LOC119653091 [Hermetia illucens]CAD7086151.1 unnamed protein product [Hermetia illucens]
MHTFSSKIISGIFLILIITKISKVASCKVFTFSDKISDSLSEYTLVRNNTFNCENGSFQFLRMNDTNLIKISGEILQMNEKDYLYLEGMLILPGFARKFDTGKDKVIYFGGPAGQINPRIAATILG